jgi:hypothetical protein
LLETKESRVSATEYCRDLWFFYHLNLAIGKFAGDARHQWRRRINILQAIDNEAGSVKLPIPEGAQNMRKKMFTKTMNEFIP